MQHVQSSQVGEADPEKGDRAAAVLLISTTGASLAHDVSRWA
jgi:hypothetical protein